MIVFPKNWSEIGREITPQDFADCLMTVLAEIDCHTISLSGGLDSSLVLYYLHQLFDDVEAYTFCLNEEHPDYQYARLIAEELGVKWHPLFPGEPIEADEFGDGIVKEYYEYLKRLGVKSIIACDGVDEFMCGYYIHQESPDEATYFSQIRRLQQFHLEPLNRNSGDIKVHLPYMDSHLLYMYSMIPLSEKVDAENRKKFLQKLAGPILPHDIIERRKYGFCDALTIK